MVASKDKFFTTYLPTVIAILTGLVAVVIYANDTKNAVSSLKEKQKIDIQYIDKSIKELYIYIKESRNESRNDIKELRNDIKI